MSDLAKDLQTDPDEAVEASAWRFASEAELQAIFVHAPLPVLLLDRHGDICLSNRVFGKNAMSGGFGLAIGEALRCVHSLTRDGVVQCGKGPVCHLCPLRSLLRESVQSDRHHYRRPVTLTIEGRQHKQLHLFVTAVPTWVAGDRRVLVYLEDVTELHRMRIIAEQFNRELEWKVDSRTKEVRQLLEQKRAFINQLGHDLRTPLTPLVALLPLLRQYVHDPKGLEMIDVILENTDQMWELVRDTLDLIRVGHSGAGQTAPPLVLRDQVEAVLAELAPQLADADVEAENMVPASYHVKVDEDQLQDVFIHLVGNAINFTPAGGRVTITATQSDETVEVCVRDTGMGMEIAQLTRVFDEFYKADESRHDRCSSGLGLSICKRIVENHGGRIWAESEGLGRGSTIRFIVPGADSPAMLVEQTKQIEQIE